jgi:hypothetical protein
MPQNAKDALLENIPKHHFLPTTKYKLNTPLNDYMATSKDPSKPRDRDTPMFLPSSMIVLGRGGSSFSVQNQRLEKNFVTSLNNLKL